MVVLLAAGESSTSERQLAGETVPHAVFEQPKIPGIKASDQRVG
ncbi:MAG: hypothetical protein ABGY32_15700 [bacterium]